MFIAIDGIDGAGKTTLARNLCRVLHFLSPILTKEPTEDSVWGRKLREAAANGRLSREEEVEYFHKDRLAHIQEFILPNLKQGRLVISDRYVDSSLAFQVDTPEEADRLYEQFLPQILEPDVTFILMCPVAEGLARIKREGRPYSRFETPETLERAKAIYESRQGRNYELLDASISAEETLRQAIEALVRRYPELAESIRTQDTSEQTGTGQANFATI